MFEASLDYIVRLCLKTNVKIQLLWQKREKYKLTHLSVSQRREKTEIFGSTVEGLVTVGIR